MSQSLRQVWSLFVRIKAPNECATRHQDVWFIETKQGIRISTSSFGLLAQQGEKMAFVPTYNNAACNLEYLRLGFNVSYLDVEA